MLSYFLSLNYCYLYLFDESSPTIVQDVISNCTELKVLYCIRLHLSLNLAHNHNLQQLYIDSPDHGSYITDVPDHFMTSVSAHGGLVHVVMRVHSLTFKGISSLVRNSPKLITLHLCVEAKHLNVENFNSSLKKMFWNRKLFTAGHCMIDVDKFPDQAVLREQDTDLLPLWGRE